VGAADKVGVEGFGNALTPLPGKGFALRRYLAAKLFEGARIGQQCITAFVNCFLWRRAVGDAAWKIRELDQVAAAVFSGEWLDLEAGQFRSKRARNFLT
jgi:hypothetical protein